MRRFDAGEIDETRRAMLAVPNCPFARIGLELLGELERLHALDDTHLHDSQMMWQVGVEGDWFHLHPRSPGCVGAGCIPVEQESSQP